MKDLDDFAERLLDIISELEELDLRRDERLLEIQKVVRRAFPRSSVKSVNALANRIYSAAFGDSDEIS